MTRQYKQREHFTLTCPDCSVEFSTNSYRTIRCKPCAKYSEYKNNMLKPEWRLKKLVAAAKNRSKEKNLPFNLDLDFMINLWQTNEGKCEITKRDFDLTPWGEKGQVNPNAPSIDRINPKLGYIQTNVRLVIYHVNIALSEYGLDMFKDLIKDIR